MSDIITPMSKIELVKYLKDYAYLQERYIKRREMGYFESFKWFMYTTGRKTDNTIEYFNTMNRVYSLYTNFKMYSVTEDYFLNRDNLIDNTKIDSFIHNCNFIEKPRNISNKRILEILRNTFNHCLCDQLLFSKNAKKIAIDINDTRYPRQINKGGSPEPLKMKFDINYLFSINDLISKNGQNVLFTCFDIPDDFDITSKHLHRELKKVKFERYYFDGKLEDTKLNELKKLNTNPINSKQDEIEHNKKLNDFANTINESTKFDLMYDQKQKVIEVLDKYKEHDVPLLKWDSKYILESILNDLIPIPGLKINIFNGQLYYLALLTDKKQYSFKELVIHLGHVIKKIEKDEKLDKLSEEKQLKLFTHLVDSDFMQILPYMFYIESVINCLCDEDIITINGKDYEKFRLRNSLVHCRWFIGSNGIVHLYDANPQNKYDYDLKEVAHIDIRDFILWADNYLNEKLIEDKNYIYKLNK